MLPVEFEFLPEITGRLQELRRQKRRGLAPDTGASGTVQMPPEQPESPMPPYTREDIARLKAEISGFYLGVTAIFDLCAQRGGWVIKADADAQAGLSAKHVANQLVHFSTAVKRLFGKDHPWPVEVRRWGGAYFYRLHPTVADWWQSAN
jgi:hypothetical protein